MKELTASEMITKLPKKKKLRSLPKLLKDAEKIFNAFIRRRDSVDGFFTCISCGQVKEVWLMNAGHYIPVGKSSYLRFHENNCNGECAGCNCFDPSHLIWYRRNLVAKVGEDGVRWLEDNRSTPQRWSREELNEIIEKYK